ncbi:interferon-induced protein 44-like isoform X3 [Nelusetta ayraudi]|uniref:interferon-induced protein 44-like isoform X3 n=1 Tax=Nelusetta ayraudi TaxID=303726 RepID=UPI003F713102
MGGNKTKPEPLLSKPWRKINWTNSEEPLQYVKNYKNPVEGQKIRILLYGPAGVGKSSFVNSIQSILLGRMFNMALVDSIMGRGFTKKFAGYQVLKDEVSHCPLVFYDMMGLEEDEGVLVEDVRLVLDGRVKDGYEFNPDSELSEDNEFYNKSPTFSDKVHVLVCVVPADKGPTIVKEKTLGKIKGIRRVASSRGIPQVVLLTKIDELCPEIQEDLENVYRLQSVKLKLEQFQADLGIPMNCIFPVKNYIEEIDLDNKVDSLLLSAVRNIITAGGDYYRRQKQST